MDSRESRAQPGWYPSPDGTQRYWDGVQWLAIPAPTPPQSADAKAGRRSRRIWALVAVIAVIAVGILVAVGVGIKAEQDRELAAEEAARAEEVASAQAAEDAAAAEAAAQRDQERADAEAREQRREATTGIEASIEEMAAEHIEEGIIEGPVLEVSCSPVAGGSIDDLAEQTTVFDCFVATEDNGDGTMSGLFYNATMNWSTGAYTYSFGAP